MSTVHINSQKAAEIRYGRGITSSMEWAKEQTSIGRALGGCLSILGDSLRDLDGLLEENADSIAMYLDFAQVGHDISEATTEYSESSE